MEIPAGAQHAFPKNLLLSGKEETYSPGLRGEGILSPGAEVSS